MYFVSSLIVVYLLLHAAWLEAHNKQSSVSKARSCPELKLKRFVNLDSIKLIEGNYMNLECKPCVGKTVTVKFYFPTPGFVATNGAHVENFHMSCKGGVYHALFQVHIVKNRTEFGIVNQLPGVELAECTCPFNAHKDRAIIGGIFLSPVLAIIFGFII